MHFFDFEASIPLKLDTTFLGGQWGGGGRGCQKFVLRSIWAGVVLKRADESIGVSRLGGGGIQTGDAATVDRLFYHWAAEDSF